MIFSLKEVLILFIILQLFVFAFALATIRRFHHSGHLYLSLFFFVLGLNILNYLLLVRADYFINTKSLHLFFLGSAFAFSYAPSFFIYVKAITIANFRPSSRILLHYVPFFLLMCYMLCNYTFLPVAEKREIMYNGGLFSFPVYQALTLLVHIQVLIYTVLTITHIYKIRRKLKNLYSCVEKLNFSWISSMLAALLCLWMLDLFRFFSSTISMQLHTIVEISLFAGFVFFCYYFIYRTLSHKLLIQETDLQSGSKRFSLSSTLRDKYQQRLENYMTEHKPFLDPEITLVELSHQVGIPPRSLSEVINASFRQNFYDFINSYRIKESELLFRSAYKNKTILEVLYEVGFNSKSSFNSSFKKLTGMTPTEYRRHYNYSNEPQKQAV